MSKDLKLMQAIVQKMDYLEARQKVLAQNIANADTPGYRPQDISAPDFKGLLESSASKLPLTSTSLATTNSAHMTSGGGSAAATQAPAKNQKKTYETAPANNSVVLEEQLLKMNENFTDHRFITNLYQKNIDMLKMSTRSQ